MRRSLFRAIFPRSVSTIHHGEELTDSLLRIAGSTGRGSMLGEDLRRAQVTDLLRQPGSSGSHKLESDQGYVHG